MIIAICDDEIKFRQDIKYYVKTHSTSHEIMEFSSAIPLLECIYGNKHFDILFLDIQMPDSDGWEVAKRLKMDKISIYIAMVTINDSYIYDCFDRVDWFTPKPVSEEKIHKILNNAYDKLFPKVYEFVSNKVTIVLTAQEIRYIEVKHNDVFIHAIGSTYKIRETLSNINKQLNFPDFVLTHQSFLINLEHFKSIKDTMVILANGEEIPLSRNKRKQFYNALREYVIRRKSYV